uniref:Uncharacterized protein n=1 Tax=Proboscia inermis TaxID=420281 RepID=A0A7S0GF54_9STRA|mmetsp:Transcript_29652/g.29982  ORF Transcript_29652/g.29982 Transcript_29652/m.29982 type:complete len:214 (+) Transcript_29652:113-754(+)
MLKRSRNVVETAQLTDTNYYSSTDAICALHEIKATKVISKRSSFNLRRPVTKSSDGDEGIARPREEVKWICANSNWVEVDIHQPSCTEQTHNDSIPEFIYLDFLDISYISVKDEDIDFDGSLSEISSSSFSEVIKRDVTVPKDVRWKGHSLLSGELSDDISTVCSKKRYSGYSTGEKCKDLRHFLVKGSMYAGVSSILTYSLLCTGIVFALCP